MQIARLLLPGLALAASACTSNPVCTDEAAGRLLRECLISVTVATGGSCRGLPGAPEAPDDPAYREHHLEMCEIADPDGLDPACLETVTCEALAMDPNVCTTEAGEEPQTPSAARNECLDLCFRQVTECVPSCDAAEDFEACLECESFCTQQNQDCVDDCPE